jgi:hypothetical protein
LSLGGRLGRGGGARTAMTAALVVAAGQGGDERVRILIEGLSWSPARLHQPDSPWFIEQ